MSHFTPPYPELELGYRKAFINQQVFVLRQLLRQLVEPMQFVLVLVPHLPHQQRERRPIQPTAGPAPIAFLRILR